MGTFWRQLGLNRIAFDMMKIYFDYYKILITEVDTYCTVLHLSVNFVIR